MYKIKYNEEHIFKFNEQELSLDSAVLSEEINKISSLVLSFNASNINANKIEKLTGEIVVFENDAEIFRGRCINISEDFYKDKENTSEGTLAYLKDTLQAPYIHQGSIEGFLEYLLQEHNKKVSEKQKIYLGNVTVVDSNNYIRRESSDKERTYNIIQEKLIKTHGGFLNIRRTNGKNYLDYLADCGVSDQVVRFGENLMDLTRYTKSENLSTVFYAKGAEKEDGTYTTVESVNNRKTFIVREDLKEKYGWIEEEIEWEDVTEPNNLLKKLKDYANNVSEIETIELSAIDARLLGVDARRITPGQRVRVVSKPHGIDKYFICNRKETNLLEPDLSLIYLGSEYKTFTGTISSSNTEIKEEIKKTENTLAEDIENSKKEFNAAIKNANGLFQTNVKKPDNSTVIYLHNKQNLNDSDIQIVINDNGIAVSNNGGNNWYGLSVDGDLIAKILTATGVKAEWVQTGTMQADRVRGGELILGGDKNKDGILKIKDSSGNVIGTWDSNGIYASKGSFNGEIVSSIGKIGNWTITNQGLYSSYTDSNGDKYTVYLQTLLEDVGKDTWVFHVQKQKKGENFATGIMFIKGDGSIYTEGDIEVNNLTIRGKVKGQIVTEDAIIAKGQIVTDEAIITEKELLAEKSIFTNEEVVSKGSVFTEKVFVCKNLAGVNRTFTIGDKTVTVTGGIITSIS